MNTSTSKSVAAKNRAVAKAIVAKIEAARVKHAKRVALGLLDIADEGLAFIDEQFGEIADMVRDDKTMTRFERVMAGFSLTVHSSSITFLADIAQILRDAVNEA